MKPTARELAEWAAKLKAAGFEDAENPDGSLKVERFKRRNGWKSALTLAAAQDWQALASSILEERELAEPAKTLWALFAAGSSLNSAARDTGLSVWTVRRERERFESAIKREMLDS